MDKQQYAEKFESLVGKRFDTLAKLEEYLTKEFQTHENVKLDFSYINYEEDFLPDWDLCGLIDNYDIYCDLDIYFLYDREQHLYITEVGYDIDMKKEHCNV